MVKFVMIRHGYSQFNKQGRYTGQLDVPLEELGVLQAHKTAEYVVKNYQIDAIYSSDLSRAMDTVRPVAEALGLPIHQEKDLREEYLGNWQGKLIEEVNKEETYIRWMEGMTEGIGDRESKVAFRERSLAIVDKIAKENEGKCVLLSSHGGVINALLREWLGAEVSQGIEIPTNSSVSVVQYDIHTKSAKVLLVGYREHLQSDFSVPSSLGE